jgi:hypothetical protein
MLGWREISLNWRVHSPQCPFQETTTQDYHDTRRTRVLSGEGEGGKLLTPSPLTLVMKLLLQIVLFQGSRAAVRISIAIIDPRISPPVRKYTSSLSSQGASQTRRASPKILIRSPDSCHDLYCTVCAATQERQGESKHNPFSTHPVATQPSPDLQFLELCLTCS